MAALVKYKVPREAALVKWKHLSSTKVCLRAGNAEEMQLSLRKGREGSFEERLATPGMQHSRRSNGRERCILNAERDAYFCLVKQKKKIGSGENIFCVFLFDALGPGE